jgi:hypothetical protein
MVPLAVIAVFVPLLGLAHLPAAFTSCYTRCGCSTTLTALRAAGCAKGSGFHLRPWIQEGWVRASLIVVSLVG